MSLTDPDGVSPYDRLVWPEGAIEQLLATGQRRREVMAYLGEQEYQLLQAHGSGRGSHSPHTAITACSSCPGIMGSQLGLPRQAPLPDNLLWVDPMDFQQGNLGLLALARPGHPFLWSGAVQLPGAEIRAADRRLHGPLFRLRLAS